MAPAIEKFTREDFPDGIPAFGCDALRFTFAALATKGRDITFGLGRIEGYRNFCNKIWNASRYVLMNCEEHPCGAGEEAFELGLADRWIISRLQETEAEVERAISNYRFDLASQAIYEFIWNEYCDWYLELSKPILWDEDASPALKTGTRRTLIRVLEAALRLAHPMMPFITEEIWQRVAPLADKHGPTIMLQPFPVADDKKIDTSATADIEWLKRVIDGIRNIRGEMTIPPGKAISVLLRNGDDSDKKRLSDNKQYLEKLAKLAEIRFLADGEKAPVASAAIVGDLEILVPMAGLIDKDAELDRLAREIDRLDRELRKVKAKLANSGFVDKAPAEVVAREREKLTSQQQTLDKLQFQVQQLESL
jgi:valyl-tRNA synthetase